MVFNICIGAKLISTWRQLLETSLALSIPFFRTWEKKTLIDPGKIHENIFSSLQISFWKIRFEW